MKLFSKTAALLGAALIVGVVPSQLLAQQDQQPDRQNRGGGGGQGGPGGPGGRGNFDPEQMRQRMMDRMKEQMEVTDDAEWKIISERITKVSELRMSGGGFGGMFGGPRGGGRGGDNGGRQRPGGSAESDALRQAIENKASAGEIKTLLAKLRESRKANEAKLEKAQDELKAVLNARQEAVAVMMGLIK